MPSYEERLKEKELWQVALYVRTLAPSPPPATGSAP
jgi:mono/diheme cytochrome c family protein